MWDHKWSAIHSSLIPIESYDLHLFNYYVSLIIYLSFISFLLTLSLYFFLGDISFRFLDYIKAKNLKECHVTVCDINAAMLEVGKVRSKRLQHNPDLIDWVEGNAETLPFPDNSFNCYTIAFGIRNVTHIDKVKTIDNISINQSKSFTTQKIK